MAQIPKNLDVYNLSYDLAVKIFEKTKNIPGNFRLKEQIHGSSISVPSNLAEFCAFENPNQQLNKLQTCAGEANETETRLDYLKDVGLLSEEDHKELFDQLEEVKKKIYRLKKRIWEVIDKNKFNQNKVNSVTKDLNDK